MKKGTSLLIAAMIIVTIAIFQSCCVTDLYTQNKDLKKQITALQKQRNMNGQYMALCDSLIKQCRDDNPNFDDTTAEGDLYQQWLEIQENQ